MNSLVTVFFLLTFIACTSDKVAENPAVAPEFKPTFNFTINEESSSENNGFVVTKTENIFSLIAETALGQVIVSFDKSGQFGAVKIDRRTGTQSITSNFYSFYYNSSHYFEFNLLAVDEVNKKIKGNFSGYLYADPLNLNSEKKYVTGAFEVKYEDSVPGFHGIGNTAKINGNSWFSTNKYVKRGVDNFYTYFTRHDFNGGEYELLIYYRFQVNPIDPGTVVGTYNFTNTDVTRKVEITRFDTSTGIPIVYDCSGVLTITKIEDGIITGSYDFSAVNPNNGSDHISVTDGKFKIIAQL